MTVFIAELDERQQIAAVWVKDSFARGPRVFDPRKHRFDTTSATDFWGAPRAKIEKWIAGHQDRSDRD